MVALEDNVCFLCQKSVYILIFLYKFAQTLDLLGLRSREERKIKTDISV